MTPTKVWPLVLTSMLLACGDDAGSSEDDTSTGGTASDESSSGSTEAGDDSSAGPSETSADSSESGFDPPMQECGNGFVEGNEQCDDANDDPDDGCTNDCQVPCGLQWFALRPASSPLSSTQGVAIERLDDERIVVGGTLREVTTDDEGNPTYFDPEGVVYSLDNGGAQGGWESSLQSPDGALVLVDLAVAPDGPIYAIATVDAADGGQDILAVALERDSGATVWSRSLSSPVEGGNDEAWGIAIGSDGNPVLSGQIRVGDGDDDVWVLELDASTGDEVWSATWGGIGTEQGSNDNGGPIAIGPDGNIYVFGQEYFGSNAVVGTVIVFGPDGGEAIATHAVSETTTTPLSIALDADGGLVIAFEAFEGVLRRSTVQKLDPDGFALQWEVDEADFEGLGDTLSGIAVDEAGDVFLSGAFVREGQQSYLETWYRRYDGEGAALCEFQLAAPDDGLLTPSLQPFDLAPSLGSSLLVTGLHEMEGQEGIFVASFRGE